MMVHSVTSRCGLDSPIGVYETSHIASADTTAMAMILRGCVFKSADFSMRLEIPSFHPLYSELATPLPTQFRTRSRVSVSSASHPASSFSDLADHVTLQMC